MPAMANITVKKNDGTTDVVYVALTPSAGDKTPARWSVTASSTKANLRTTAEMQSRFNGGRNARHVDLTVKMPEVAQVNGIDTVVGLGHISISGLIPLQISDATINELTAQAANLFKAALIQDCFRAGYAAQ